MRQCIALTELKGQFREERFFQIKIIRFKSRRFATLRIAETISKAELGAAARRLDFVESLREIGDYVVDMLCTD